MGVCTGAKHKKGQAGRDATGHALGSKRERGCCTGGSGSLDSGAVAAVATRITQSVEIRLAPAKCWCPKSSPQGTGLCHWRSVGATGAAQFLLTGF